MHSFLFALALQTLVIYDGASNKAPHVAPWTWGLVGTGGQVSGPAGNQYTTLDTTATNSVQMGWLNVSLLPIEAKKKPLVRFDLRMVSESHANANRAGLSVILLTDTKQGIELSFWEDRIWVQNDNPLFTHGEEAILDTKANGTGRGGLRKYEVRFLPGSYAISVDSRQVLTGPLRNYEAFQGFPDPYEIPNVLWVGDDTQSASAKFDFSYFQVEILPTINKHG